MTDNDYSSGDPWGLDDPNPAEPEDAPQPEPTPDLPPPPPPPPTADVEVDDLDMGSLEVAGFESAASDLAENADTETPTEDLPSIEIPDSGDIEATLAELTDVEPAADPTPASEPTEAPRQRGPFSAMLAGTGLFGNDAPETADTGVAENLSAELEIPDLHTPAADIDAPEADVDLDEVVADLDVKDLGVPDLDIPEADLEEAVADLDLPDLDLDFDEVVADLDTPDLDAPETDLEEAVADLDIPDPDETGAGVDAPEVEVPDASTDDLDVAGLLGDFPSVDVSSEPDVPDLDPPLAKGGAAVPSTDADLPDDLPSWLSDEAPAELPASEPPVVFKELEGLDADHDDGMRFGAVLHSGREAVEPFADAISSDDPDEAIAAIAAAAAALDADDATEVADHPGDVTESEPDDDSADHPEDDEVTASDAETGEPDETAGVESTEPVGMVEIPEVPDVELPDASDALDVTPEPVDLADPFAAPLDAGVLDAPSDVAPAVGVGTPEGAGYTEPGEPTADEPMPSIPVDLGDSGAAAPSQDPQPAKATGAVDAPDSSWASRWQEAAQGWQEAPDGSSTWRPIVATASTLSEWTVDTYLGVVVADRSLAAAEATDSTIAQARDESTQAMVADALERGAHAVIGVALAVQSLGERVLVTSSGTAVTLRSSG